MRQLLSAVDAIDAFESPQRPDHRGFDSLNIDEIMRRFHVPGIQVAAISNFSIHWTKTYGVADAESQREVDTDTLFQAGSISKAVASMGLLRAVEDGSISLDGDVNLFLRSWQLEHRRFGARSSDTSRPVTPRMFASHTAGLGDGFGFPGYEPGNPLPTTKQILRGEPPANTGPVLMRREPLSAMQYSGGGSTILELAMQDVTKCPFAQFMRDRVLNVIGMSRSAYEQPLSEGRQDNAASGHYQDGKRISGKWHIYPELYAAGLWTTAVDLAKFAIEVQRSIHGESNCVLSRSMVQEMSSPVGVGDFAVGFRIDRRGQGWYLSHTGSTEGFGCLLVVHKIHGYGLSVMTNVTHNSEFLTELRDRVERAYGWDTLDKAIPR